MKKGFLVPGIFAVAVILVAIAWGAPRCAPNDHSGIKIGSVILVGGCR